MIHVSNYDWKMVLGGELHHIKEIYVFEFIKEFIEHHKQ
jgi:uncharacterized protein involved in tellurium resistance